MRGFQGLPWLVCQRRILQINVFLGRKAGQSLLGMRSGIKRQTALCTKTVLSWYELRPWVLPQMSAVITTTLALVAMAE